MCYNKEAIELNRKGLTFRAEEQCDLTLLYGSFMII